MGDTSIALVLEYVDKNEASQLAEKLVAHLLARRIITESKNNCVLGQENGYPPGENYKQTLENPTEVLKTLKTNGLAVSIGKQVFNAQEVDEVNCPNCNSNIFESDWGDALEEWINETGNDIVVCPDCSQTNSITKFHFKPAWAFGELGFTFWNWGENFTDEFIDEIENILRQRITIIHNKI